MKIEFLRALQDAPRPHAEGPADRPPARLRARGQPRAVAAQPAQPAARRGARWASSCSACRRSAAARHGAATPSGAPRDASMFASARRDDRCRARGGKAAVLFVDTFNGNFETENALRRGARAAGRGLHACTRVEQADGGHLCCGRTYLASGMVDEAKAKARRAARRAAAVGRAPASPIVGLEPSCLLTLRDEALVMGLGDDGRDASPRRRCCSRSSSRAKRKAGRFALALQAGRRSRSWCTATATRRPSARSTPMLDVLRLIPGAKPELIESSCCGMAGSFGYEAAHHEVSMQMAEAEPAARGARGARRDRRGRRHQLPPPDRRRRAARGGARGAAARRAARLRRPAPACC